MTSPPAHPEFSHRVSVERIPLSGADHQLEAGEDARRRLAGRFGLESIKSLRADLVVRREGAAVVAEGIVEADVVQSCVVSGEPVAAQVREPVQLRFVAPAPVAPDAEIELDFDALDECLIEEGMIDLGEAVAQTLALALDPFPRAAADVLAAARARLMSEEEAARLAEAASPFARLKTPG
ncbi:MAG: DUF177 domain-containing protein [Sphingomonadaceae bacterium]